MTRKIFCIGFSKTGTKSMKAVLPSLGFSVGQGGVIPFMDDWAKRDFFRIVNYCRNADAFEDVPFSLDFTYNALDQEFPGSKFILTVRDSSEAWYQSLRRYMTKLVGKGRLPTADDMREYTYPPYNSGWLWRSFQYMVGTMEDDPFNRERCIAAYEAHNDGVLRYFQHRPDDLLVLNLGHEKSKSDLCRFLGVEYDGTEMPRQNTSQ